MEEARGAAVGQGKPREQRGGKGLRETWQGCTQRDGDGHPSASPARHVLGGQERQMY